MNAWPLVAAPFSASRYAVMGSGNSSDTAPYWVFCFLQSKNRLPWLSDNMTGTVAKKFLLSNSL
ncbi:MAG: hypothetical protein F6J95_008980 [Leptolyngbya sp. SIO1E4]|nr:hypothetical protein [Leptolyngbya sp. SIO1E4]